MTISSPLDALNNYTGNGFYRINSGLRRGKVHQVARQIDRLMRAGWMTETLYRATSLEEVTDGKRPEIGSVVYQPAFLSTSRDPEMQFYRAKQAKVWIELTVPASVRRIVIADVFKYRAHHPEQEVLLQRGLHWRIDSAKCIDNRFHVCGTVLEGIQ